MTSTHNDIEQFRASNGYTQDDGCFFCHVCLWFMCTSKYVQENVERKFQLVSMQYTIELVVLQGIYSYRCLVRIQTTAVWRIAIASCYHSFMHACTCTFVILYLRVVVVVELRLQSMHACIAMCRGLSVCICHSRVSFLACSTYSSTRYQYTGS